MPACLLIISAVYDQVAFHDYSWASGIVPCAVHRYIPLESFCSEVTDKIHCAINSGRAVNRQIDLTYHIRFPGNG